MMLLPVVVDWVNVVEQGVTYAFMNLSSMWGTLRVVVVAFPLRNARLEDDRVHQAVGRIHYGGHHTFEIVEKHAVGACLRLTTFCSEP